MSSPQKPLSRTRYRVVRLQNPFREHPPTRQIEPLPTGSDQQLRTPVSVSERIFSVAEIAKIFACSTEKVKRKLRGNDPDGLRGFKFGRVWFVPQSELERYIQNALNSSGHLRRNQEDFQ